MIVPDTVQKVFLVHSDFLFFQEGSWIIILLKIDLCMQFHFQDVLTWYSMSLSSSIFYDFAGV